MKKLLALAVLLAIVLSLFPAGGACGYTSPAPAYSITAPPGWKTEPVSERLVRFTPPEGDVRFTVEALNEGPIPLMQFRDFSLQDMSRGTADGQLVAEEAATLGGEPAQLFQLRLTTPDTAAVDILAVVCMRDGWGYRASAVGRQGSLEGYREDFQLFVDSFTFDAAAPFPFYEDFEGGLEDDAWYMVREDPANWSLGERPGYLTIATEPGDIRGGYNNARNLLLRPCPAGDFEMTTVVDFSPAANGQQAGLLVYSGDDAYISLGRSRLGGGNVAFVYENGTIIESWPVPAETTVTWLKIARLGSDYIAYASPDGENWQFVYAYSDVALDNPSAGLFALQPLEGDAGLAQFDFFALGEVTEQPSGGAGLPGWIYIVLVILAVLLVIGLIGHGRRKRRAG